MSFMSLNYTACPWLVTFRFCHCAFIKDLVVSILALNSMHKTSTLDYIEMNNDFMTKQWYGQRICFLRDASTLSMLLRFSVLELDQQIKSASRCMQSSLACLSTLQTATLFSRRYNALFSLIQFSRTCQLPGPYCVTMIMRWATL